jgi:hypothetical protein
MSNVEDLEKALLQGVLDCVDLPVAQENASFEKPADGGPWARALVLSNMPSIATKGPGGDDAHDGIIQVDLNFPLLGGTAAVAAAAHRVQAFMRPGRVLLHAGTRAHVTGCGNPRDAEVDGYFRRTLTINWRARITRPA